MPDPEAVAEQIRLMPYDRVDALVLLMGEGRLPYLRDALSVCYDRDKGAMLDIDFEHVRQIDVRKAILYICACNGRVEI
jgi:hypothetical protein